MKSCASMLLFGLVAFAQDAPQPAKGKERTMTGCLTKGADQPQHYNFTNQENGRKMVGDQDRRMSLSRSTLRITPFVSPDR